MDKKVIEKLDKTNREFYEEIAGHFDKSRRYPWKGWKKYTKYFLNKKISPKNILDVACGNGRFYPIITKAFPEIRYIGLDNNKALINIASSKYPEGGFIEKSIEKYLSLPNETTFDQIVLFGIIHHIPDKKARIEMLNKLVKLLSPGGFITIAFWNFLDEEYTNKKVLTWDKIGLSRNDVEKNDYLLSWDRKYYRYCHYSDQEEIKELTSEANLKIMHSYKADGRTNNLNRYIICKKISGSS
jgi:SAM-dependent methyltransferase